MRVGKSESLQVILSTTTGVICKINTIQTIKLLQLQYPQRGWFQKVPCDMVYMLIQNFTSRNISNVVKVYPETSCFQCFFVCQWWRQISVCLTGWNSGATHRYPHTLFVGDHRSLDTSARNAKYLMFCFAHCLALAKDTYGVCKWVLWESQLWSMIATIHGTGWE